MTAGDIKDRLIAVLDNGLGADQFESASAHCLLTRVAQMNHEVEDDDVDISSTCGERFQNCLDALTCDPSVRCVAPKIYVCVADYLGECSEESIGKVGVALRELGQIFQEVLQEWTGMLDGGDCGDLVEGESPLMMLSNIWISYLDRCTDHQAINQPDFQQFIDSFLFSFQLTITVLNINEDSFYRVYCDWLSLVLAHRLVFPNSDHSPFTLQLMLVPPLVKLFMSPTGDTAALDAPTPCRRAQTSGKLCHLKDMLNNPLALGGLFGDDAGHEAYRVMLECALQTSNQEPWCSALEAAFKRADCLSSALVNGTQPIIYGLPSNAWIWPIAVGGHFAFTPALVVAQLTLRQMAPLAALQSKALVSTSTSGNKDLFAKQAFALAVVRTLLASMPHRLIAPAEFLIPEITLTSIEESSTGQADEPVTEDTDTEGAEPKKATNKQQTLRDLQMHLAQPLLAFICQTLFLAPERRDLRDKLLTFISEIVRAAKPYQVASTFLDRLIVALVKLSNHDKSLIRIVALELLGCLVLDHPEVAMDCPRLPTATIAAMMMRGSDVQPTVRARAIDLIAICLNHMIKLCGDPRYDSLCVWLTAFFVGGTGLEWGTLFVLLDLRLQDEKLLARKAGVALIEACVNVIGLLKARQLTVDRQSLLDYISEEQLTMVVDDAALTVRQRSVVMTATLLGSDDCLGRLVGAKCLLRLALDNEESISSKARQILSDQIIAPLPLELRRFLRSRRQDPSGGLDRFGNVALMSALLNDKDVAESVFRILVARTREDGCADISNIVTSITDEHLSEDACMLIPIGVLRLLNLCLEVGISLSKSWTKVSGELAQSLFEAMCKHRVLSCAHEEQIDYVSVCLRTLKFLAEFTMNDKNKQLLLNHTRDCLGTLSIHHTLARPSLEIYFTLLPDQKAYRTEITRLILFVRESISTENRQEMTAMQAATAFQVAGFAYAMSARLPASNKVAVHLSEMAPALATFMLGIARNAFQDKQAFVDNKENTESQVDLSHWVHNVPSFLRGIALTSAAQVLLVHEPVAKRLMPHLILSGFSPCVTDGPNPLLANLAFAVADFSLKMTSLVDPYFVLISSILATEGNRDARDGFLRCQVLALLSQQAAQDYLKPKGLLLYHLLYALGDPLSHVRDLAQRVFSAILIPKTRDVLHGYFVELICFLCGFLNHPQIRLAIDLHPMALDVPGAMTMCVDNFQLREDGGRRSAIYASLLASATDVTKHALIKKIFTLFLKPFLSGGTGSDVRQTVPLPLSRDTPVGLALADVLHLLASSDMQLTFSAAASASLFVQPTGTELSTSIAEEEIKEAKEHRAKRCRDLLKEFVSKSLVPILTALRRALQECNSALQKEVFECLATILFEWREELDDIIVDDPRLIQLLRRSYAECMTDKTNGTTTCSDDATFEEVFLKQDLRSRYARKPLSQNDTGTQRRRSVVNICSAGARSANTLNTSVIMVRSTITTTS